VSPELHKLIVRWRTDEIPPSGIPKYFDIVEGDYIECGKHDGRMVYKKCGGKIVCPVVIYWCGPNWSPAEQGWWIAVDIGSEAVYVHNPGNLSDVPFNGWQRLGQPVPIEIVPKALQYQVMYEEVVEQFRAYKESHEQQHVPQQADVLQTQYDLLQHEHEELKIRHAELIVNYKQALKDKHQSRDEPAAKVARVVQPPEQPGLQEYVSSGGSASSSSAAAATTPAEDEEAAQTWGRTRARTRAGVRVQAQRIVDLFVNERYSDLARQPPDQRYHW
jgi:hypothetical protein